MWSRRNAAALLSCALLAACSQSSTRDELKAAIADYQEEKNGVTAQQVDALFAKLDAEIAAEKADVAAKPMNARADDERRVAADEAERSRLVEVYASARLVRFGRAAGEAARGVGDAVGGRLEDAGRRLHDSLQDGGPDRAPDH